MLRKIIHIDEEKCTGCGLCARACHEGAIEIIDGKAKLTREDYCDGMGDCLPNCPVGAITFEEREAPAYNEQAVLDAKQKKKIVPLNLSHDIQEHQWPYQIKLVPVQAPYFSNSRLLIVADCAGFACPDIRAYMKDHVLLIGCTKLDAADYSEKFAEIFDKNDIKDITILKMQVPCCSGMSAAVSRALNACGKDIPVKIITYAPDGTITGG